MGHIIGAVAAFMLILAGWHIVQTNDLACQTELCKEGERQRQYALKVEQAFKAERQAAEAERRFEAQIASERAARERADFDSETRRIEAKAKIEREHELQLAKIRKEAQDEARDDAIALAKYAGSRSRSRGIIGTMCRSGMGQCGRRRIYAPYGQVRYMQPRQPRYGIVVTTGYPGGRQRQPW